MPLPRRTFLRDAFKSTLSVGLLLAASRAGFGQTRSGVRLPPPNNPLDIPLEAQKDPVFRFVEATFRPYLNGIFQAPNARGEMIELRLIKIGKHAQVNRLTKLARTSDSFSLIFEASAELPPFTSIHKISHPALGNFDLFLSPRKTDDGERFYEAVINHVQ
jgi:hypothetical protein